MFADITCASELVEYQIPSEYILRLISFFIIIIIPLKFLGGRLKEIEPFL